MCTGTPDGGEHRHHRCRRPAAGESVSARIWSLAPSSGVQTFGRPFIKVNCAAIPHGLLESELFGHEKGAFTGAHRRRPGHSSTRNKGTSTWTRFGELPMSLQAKWLHVLQTHFSRVGGEGNDRGRRRIIAATNRGSRAGDRAP